MLYTPRAYGVEPTKQPCWQHVADCTHWPVLVSFNNWNIILFTNKTTSSEDFDAVHKSLIDGISENMDYLVQLGKYSDTNAADPTTIKYYVIKYLFEPYTPQEYQTLYSKVVQAGELIVKVEYLSIIRAKHIGIGNNTKQNRVP